LKKKEVALRAMNSYIQSKEPSPERDSQREDLSEASDPEDLFNSSFYDRKPSMCRKI
jgi:hypothetical protein